MFRRDSTQLMGQGGLFQTGQEIFLQLPESERPRIVESRMKMYWPSGATLKYNHMLGEKHKLSHQGLAYDYVLFDEASHFTFSMVEYLMSRLRGKSKFKSRMILTTNPDPSSWLLEMVLWYLDPEGYPDESKQGVIRYFLRRDSQFIWSDTKEELIEKYSTKERKVEPLSFTFIASKLEDNPVLMANAPEYIEWLEGLNSIDKARLKDGNWFLEAKGCNYFQRDWLNKLDVFPRLVSRCRAYDKASSEVTQKTPHCDFTASCGMGKTANGDIVIFGNYCDKNYDSDLDVHGVFRKRPGEREQIILAQAHHDGENCQIILPEDPGAGGKSEFLQSSKDLIAEGFIVRKDSAPTTAGKLKKFEPFSASAQNGLIGIVESSFDRKTLEYIYKNLEGFDGERSTRQKHDDIPDAFATAFNYISQKRNVPIVCRRQTNHSTLSNSLLATM